MTPGAWIAGKYRLLRPLGKGSMGEVWAARHAEMDRDVALKLIYKDTPDRADIAARLKREAQACGKLAHPNIVRVYDIGETESGDPFLVMEMLEGETLKARIASRRRLPTAEALGVALEVARALRAAHGAGIVHRDLKPENVFLHRGRDAETDAEEVKVLDFGVSKILSLGNMAFTVSGALVGSPAYMSPEQARALKDIDGRADLWSLGVVIFEMLSGRRPFMSQTTMGVITEILGGTIPTLASVVPDVDPRLDALVNRCITRDIDQRMPSAAALIGTLRPLLSVAAESGRGGTNLVDSAPVLPRVQPVRADPRDEPTVTDRAAVRAHVHMPDPDDEDDKATTRIPGDRADLYRLVAARAAAGASPSPPLVAPPADEPEEKGTERIPEHTAELYRLAALRASHSNNPAVRVADARPGAVTAMLADQLPPSPTWQVASGGTHKMASPAQRWPGLAPDEAERPTRVMPWKQDKASGSRSLAVGVAAGLALALLVVVTIVLARCGPDDGASGARPGTSAAPPQGTSTR